MPAPPETPLQVVERLRAKLRETEDMLVVAEELLRATGHSWEDVERDKAAGDFGQCSVRSAAGPYRLLVEQISEPALTVMHNGSIVFCNSAFADLVGVPRERLSGIAIDEILSGNAPQKSVVDELTSAAQRERQWSLRTSTGAKSVSLSCRSVRLFGKAVHSLVVKLGDVPAAHMLARTDDHAGSSGHNGTGQQHLQQSDGHD
ncbi:PAS domain-containing protein [Rhizomicrobium electricum]|uniref:PAS domain-containing protein n=1 Tax=Rhizomicrobium electricum TaxID=480070 RepID=UPI0014211D63|nr:PAS domain-containing protein [Rhizomicrobium electricum]NIJ47954.1 PAS domain-containing protein [Rhizomicrobium electricum]